MNLLARILSHGFAFAVVAIIIIVLMYRGEFSPGWELPDFLAIESQPEATAEADSGTVARAADEAVPPADPAAITPEPAEEPAVPLAPVPAAATSDDIPPAVAPESPEEPLATGSMDSASNEVPPPEDEMPAAGQADDVTSLASSDTVAVTDTQTAEAVDEAPATDPAASTGSTDQAVDDAAEPSVDTLADESSTMVDDSVSTLAEEPVAADETTPADTTPVTADVAPVETTPTAAEEPEPTAEIAPATEPPAVPEKAEVSGAVDDATTETPYEVMAEARESYWLRDFDAAEQHYRKLTQIDPDNPDGYGEMGNMYFSQGKWDEAATAFYEAGTRLVKTGHLVQARQMVEVIRGLNGPQAEDLEAQVIAASSATP